MTALGTYQWTNGMSNMHVSGGCVALVRGGDIEAALDVVAPSSASEPADGIYEAFDWPQPVAPVVACRKPGWVLLVQATGHVLTDKTASPLLSRVGDVVTLTSNVNMHCAFVVARDGKIRRQFDPHAPAAGGLGFGGSATGNPLPEEADSRLASPERQLVYCYQLIELLTGIRITEADINETVGRVYRMAPLIYGTAS